MSALLARGPAHADSRLAIGCERCLAEAPVPHDETLHDVVWMEWDGGSMHHGRDANGWLVVASSGQAASYCACHDVIECRRHAAAKFGLKLPEGLR